MKKKKKKKKKNPVNSQGYIICKKDKPFHKPYLSSLE